MIVNISLVCIEKGYIFMHGSWWKTGLQSMSNFFCLVILNVAISLVIMIDHLVIYHFKLYMFVRRKIDFVVFPCQTVTHQELKAVFSFCQCYWFWPDIVAIFFLHKNDLEGLVLFSTANNVNYPYKLYPHSKGFGIDVFLGHWSQVGWTSRGCSGNSGVRLWMTFFSNFPRTFVLTLFYIASESL